MEEGAVCIPNIGRKERRKRMLAGVVFLALSVAIGVALVLTGAERHYRAAVFLPLWMAALGYFQAREKT